jgi:cellulose synthase/poly-beta-1,6-N-acetylglucosamine synthase-like glycosyltransferase
VLTTILWAFLGITLIQLIYWALFYLALTKDKAPASAMHVQVSVIVCAHDEEQNLRELVPQLLNQNHTDFEIIIVNDRSNDGTYDFLLQETKKHDRLKMVHVATKPEHVNGKKFALTLGIKAARYDWVLLTDADCRPGSTDWIRMMAGTFSAEKTMVLGYSPYQVKSGFLNTFIRFETIVTGIQYISFALLGQPYMGVGRNLAYRKDLFLKNKGFSSHLEITGGDDDLFVNQHAQAETISIQLNAAATMVSLPKEKWSEFWQQKIRHLAVGKQYSVKSKLMLAPFTMTWVAFWPAAFVVMAFQFPMSLAAIALRWLVQFLALSRFKRLTGERFEGWKLPFLDFIFGFYYLVAGFTALFTKRVKWKT